MTIVVKTNQAEFAREMRDLGPKFGRRVMRYAIAGAAMQIRDGAKAVTPVRKTGRGSIFRSRYGTRIPGLLRRSIIAKRNNKASSQALEAYYVTARSGDAPTKGGVSRDAYYWRWVEGGHIKRRPGGALRGGSAAKSLVRSRARKAGDFVSGRWYLRRGGEQSFGRALAEFYRRAEIKLAALQESSK